MQAAGYTESGDGSNMEQGAVVATGVQFDSPQNPHLHVILSFEGQTGQRTLLQYLVTSIAVPPRPADSLIPADLAQAVVLYYPLQRGSQPIQGTVTDPADLARIAQAINSLERDTRGMHSCTLDSGHESALTLTTRSGETKAVRFRTGCGWVQVGNTLLHDPQGQVDKAVAAAFGHP